MMLQRKEFAKYYLSTFIIIVCMEATMVMDSIIGVHFLGKTAVSIVDLLLPVREVFYCFFLLTGAGATVLAAKAFGQNKFEVVKRHFTVALISISICLVTASIVLLLLRAPVVQFLTAGSDLYDDTYRYLTAMVPWFVVSQILMLVKEFTILCGRPLLSMVCGVVQFVVNVVCDCLFFEFSECGIEALAYASLISSTVGLLILLPGCVKSDSLFCIARCSRENFMKTMKEHISYGSGFVGNEISYMIFSFTMNALVIRWLGKDGLYAWSIVVMVFYVCNYASLAANETCLTFGGRFLGNRQFEKYRMIYRWGAIPMFLWILAVLLSIFFIPEYSLSILGASDELGVKALLPVIALTIPLICNTNVLGLSFLPLLQKGKIWQFTSLASSIFLAIPFLFVVFHYVFPGYEWWSFAALLPFQAAIVWRARSRFSYLSRA